MIEQEDRITFEAQGQELFIPLSRNKDDVGIIAELEKAGIRGITIVPKRSTLGKAVEGELKTLYFRKMDQ